MKIVLIILVVFAALVVLSALKVSGDCSRQEEERERRDANRQI